MKFKPYLQPLLDVLNAIIKKHLGGLYRLGVQMNQKQGFSDVPSVLAHGGNMIK
jgi:hypothetical protein